MYLFDALRFQIFLCKTGYGLRTLFQVSEFFSTTLGEMNTD